MVPRVGVPLYIVTYVGRSAKQLSVSRREILVDLISYRALTF